MKVTWVCKKCGRVEETDVEYGETGTYYAKLPQRYDMKRYDMKNSLHDCCSHDWYPVEIRRGV